MPMSSITIKPNEKGTAVVTFSFSDETDTEVTPKTNAWQLQNTSGRIINSRSFVNGSFSGTQIVLSGDDLALFGTTDTGNRVLGFQGTYDSDIGMNLSLTDEVTFTIESLLSQTDETL